MSRARSLGPALAITLLSVSPAFGADGAIRTAAESPARAETAASNDAVAKANVPAPAGDPAAIKAKADTPPPAPSYVVIARINLATQQMTLAVDGAHRHTWAISSGRSGYPTPRGSFRAQWMSRMWYSRKYDLAPMPHAVFFSGGAAIHATQATGLLGRPASHGCVRLAPANAATFYGLVQKHGLARTQVVVFGQPPAPAVARRNPPRNREFAGTRGRMSVHGGQGATWSAYAQPRVYQPVYAPQHSIWGAPIGQGNGYGYGYGYASAPRPVAPRAIRLR